MKTLQICFDLDDTLIPNTFTYNVPKWRCGLIISAALGHKCPPPADLLKLHLETDLQFVAKYGLGVDRFPASWVQTYELLCRRAGSRVDQAVARRLTRAALGFTRGPFRTFPGAKRLLSSLRRDGHALHLVTAGDDRLQAKKILRAGIRPLFDSIAITPMKKGDILAAIIKDRPDLGVMVGDSKKSDIAPAVELGMHAIWMPSQTWAFANAEIDPSKYHEIASLKEWPDLIRRLVRD